VTRFDHAIPRAAPAPVQWRGLLLFALLWIAVQALFFSTAFRIDEPNIIAIAGQIAHEPLDPYGFTINWNGTEESAFTTLANPPLVPAWLALWASLFGWSENSLHLAMLPFSLIALAAFASIARDLGIATPRTAAVALACSPAFFLAAQVVMPDIAMVAMLGASVALALRYLATNATSTLAFAAVCAALTPLMKYNGVVLTVVLAGFCVVVPQRRRQLALLTVASLTGLGIWSVISIAIYGEPHFTASSRLQGGAAVSGLTGALIALGLGVLPFALAFRTRMPAAAARVWKLALPAIAIALGFLAAFTLEYPIIPSILFAAGCTIAIHFLVSSIWNGVEDWKNGRGIEAVLVLWIVATFALQFQLLFTAVRYLLPLAMPVILLSLRGNPFASLHGRGVRGEGTLLRVLAVNGFFVLCLGIGDASTANLYRAFVEREVRPRVTAGSGTLYFDGHWGLQHYASRLGGVAVDRRAPPELRDGDILITARNAFPVSTSEIQPLRTFESDPGWLLRTIDCDGAANFHGNAIGGCRFFPVYLPFAIGSGPVERLTIAGGEGPSVIAERNF
jgi:4-amino-4-deoxy-L-arabinose transferase-like glycosyltransferase